MQFNVVLSLIVSCFSNLLNLRYFYFRCFQEIFPIKDSNTRTVNHEFVHSSIFHLEILKSVTSHYFMKSLFFGSVWTRSINFALIFMVIKDTEVNIQKFSDWVMLFERQLHDIACERATWCDWIWCAKVSIHLTWRNHVQWHSIDVPVTINILHRPQSCRIKDMVSMIKLMDRRCWCNWFWICNL